MSYGSYRQWAPYVPVAARRRAAAQLAKRAAADGAALQPVEIEGRRIAVSFWGKAWCDSLECYSDYHNRLPRGRTYVRNGSVIHLQIGKGTVDALVSGSDIYTVAVRVGRLPEVRWQQIVAECSGHIGSLLDLLQGRFANAVMQKLASRDNGLFPQPKELKFSCSCPDDASMCKHVAAVLYGVGARFDASPQLFFDLRQVDCRDLLAAAASAEGLDGAPVAAGAPELAGVDLGDLFGIELESPENPATPPTAPAAPAKTAKPRQRRARDDGFGEVFGPGLEVAAALLVAFGVPRSAIPGWIKAGVIERSGQRGVYRTTQSTLERVRHAYRQSLA